MKHCPYCGKEHPDDLEFCPVDNQPLQQVEKEQTAKPSLVKAPEYRISAEEQRFWKRMTFRQFAVVMIRLQAFWLFLNAAIDVVYLPRYITFHSMFSRSEWIVSTRELCTLLLRILVNVGAGVLIIQKAEKLLSWIIKDLVSEQAVQPEGQSKDDVV